MHAILQRPGMPVNRISNNAMRAMVDMMRDLMESVMDEAATCADSNGRVIIDSGAIMTGAVLYLHKGVNANGQGCPDIEKFMWACASQRYTAYHEFVWCGGRRKTSRGNCKWSPLHDCRSRSGPASTTTTSSPTGSLHTRPPEPPQKRSRIPAAVGLP